MGMQVKVLKLDFSKESNKASLQKQVPMIYQKIILSLEKNSIHPIACALRESFASPNQLFEVENQREIPGIGVTGYVFGRFYELKSSPIPEIQKGCILYENQTPIFYFIFENRNINQPTNGRDHEKE
jgi:hypothetical protein